MVKNFETFRNTTGGSGQAFIIDDHFIQDFEAAICCLCGHHGDTEINKLRFSLFGSKTTDLSKLQPCKNACDNHVKHANYKAAIWQNCLETKQEIPPTHGHGWSIAEDISVHWMDIPAAPKAVLQCLTCKCKKCS